MIVRGHLNKKDYKVEEWQFEYVVKGKIGGFEFTVRIDKVDISNVEFLPTDTKIPRDLKVYIKERIFLLEKKRFHL